MCSAHNEFVKEELWEDMRMFSSFFHGLNSFSLMTDVQNMFARHAATSIHPAAQSNTRKNRRSPLDTTTLSISGLLYSATVSTKSHLAVLFAVSPSKRLIVRETAMLRAKGVAWDLKVWSQRRRWTSILFTTQRFLRKHAIFMVT
jgi:hypothetical protein